MSASLAVHVGAAAAGFALGSLSPAVLVSRRAGVDVRAVGSGNPGATNVGRVLGLRAGVLVAVLDVAKGLLPAALFGTLGRSVGLVAGLYAVVGHVASPLLRGRGGKGVATAAGAVVGSFPLWGVVVVAVWVAVLALTRWVALASVCAVTSVVVLAVAADAAAPTVGWAGALAVVVVGRHRTNLAGRWAARTAASPRGRPPDADAGARTEPAATDAVDPGRPGGRGGAGRPG